MIRSMTGFGRGEHTSRAGVHATAEVKTVNHRFLDIAIRAPKIAFSLEDKLRSLIQGRFERGRVDLSLSVEEFGERPRQIKVDLELARGYLQGAEALKESFGLTGEVSLEALLRLPDMVVVNQQALDEGELWDAVQGAVQAALDAALAMRTTEGGRLAHDLDARLLEIERLTGEISERSPAVVEDYQQRLTQRIHELLGEAVVDQGRLALEVAVFADRSNITEELVRLESHLAEARATLSGDVGAVGRKLEFLLQEMNREINTIGSKANDAVIARRVIDAKAELEKIREQMQNIE